MIEFDCVGDLDGRGEIWHAVLTSAACGPQELAVLVAGLGALSSGSPETASRMLARCLGEMCRGGHVRLWRQDGRWWIDAGSRGADTLARLSPPSSCMVIGTPIR
jgi:hypothetical protein